MLVVAEISIQAVMNQLAQGLDFHADLEVRTWLGWAWLGAQRWGGAAGLSKIREWAIQQSQEATVDLVVG